MVQKKIKKFFNSVTIHECMPVLYQKPKYDLPIFAAGLLAAAICFGIAIGFLMPHKKADE